MNSALKTDLTFSHPSHTMSNRTVSRQGRSARHSRVRTGCKACRVRRVKCPEGEIDHEGRKLACRCCVRADVDCWYPMSGSPHEWARAVRPSTNAIRRLSMDLTTKQRSELKAKAGDATPSVREPLYLRRNVPSSFSCWTRTPSISRGEKPPIDAGSHCWTLMDLDDLGDLDTICEWTSASSDTLPLANLLPSRCQYDDEAITAPAGVQSSASVPWPFSGQRGSQTDFMGSDKMEKRVNDETEIVSSEGREILSALATAGERDINPSTFPLQVELRHGIAARRLLRPSPSLCPFTLSSIPTFGLDRGAVADFENRGCTEIVAANHKEINWIYTLVFPRLLALLSYRPAPSIPDARAAIREYAYHALLQLSFVHRKNMEQDNCKAIQFLAQADEHRALSRMAALRVRVHFSAKEWKTEEYLMAFFISCMADMLSSKTFAVDHTCAFEIAPEETTTFSSTLRDMIAVYSTMVAASSPHDPLLFHSLPVTTSAPFELSMSGDEWVERFFGVTRQVVVLIGWVNKLVAYRASLLRDGKMEEGSEHRLLLKKEGERIALEFSNDKWDSSVWACEAGKSMRVQRGTFVTRMALLIIVYSEILEADLLTNEELRKARKAATEIVADTESSALAGYQWALSIVAIYTAIQAERDEIQSILHNAQVWSFGAGYKGAAVVVQTCWRFFDEHGCYKNGIAPWREALAASGLSMYI